MDITAYEPLAFRSSFCFPGVRLVPEPSCAPPIESKTATWDLREIFKSENIAAAFFFLHLFSLQEL
jgi:hypothetical protein